MKREQNFEIMRVVAMFFIVVYHCLTHGVGDKYAFNASDPIPLFNLCSSDLLLVFSSIAVNLYVLVSGYFLVEHDFKPSRIVRTWVHTCFYSCAITLLFFFLSPDTSSIVSVGKSLLPVSTDAYWFVTQYIGLLILSPFLALLVRQLSYQQYVWLLIGGAFLCLSVIPDFPLGKRYHVAHGNSLWSFAYLFLIAGFIRYHLRRLPMSTLVITAGLLTLIIVAYEIVLGTHNGQTSLRWLPYNGLPFILSVVVFVLFKQVKIPETKFWSILAKTAPYTFGVYLIHDHLLVREWLWRNPGLSPWCNQPLFPLIVLGLCLLLYAACALIDMLRKKLFEVLRVDSNIAKIDRWSFHGKFLT